MAPEQMKRQFFRLSINIPIRYRFVKKTGPGTYKASRFFKGVGNNFSTGGAAIIKVGKPLPVNTLVYLEMDFPFSPDPVLATGEVVRLDALEYRGQVVPAVMIQFLVIDETVRDRMTAFIISRGKNVGPL